MKRTGLYDRIRAAVRDLEEPFTVEEVAPIVNLMVGPRFSRAAIVGGMIAGRNVGWLGVVEPGSSTEPTLYRRGLKFEKFLKPDFQPERRPTPPPPKMSAIETAYREFRASLSINATGFA